MTSDSDDVADSANRKPKGSIKPPTKPPSEEEHAHPTGEAQADENRENEPPA